MLKGKALATLISIVSLFVGLAAAAVGATFAWYSTHTTQTAGFELNANGVMVVLFEEDPILLGQLKPAVAVKDRIAENDTAFDVLTVGGNISEAAGVVTTTTYFEYLNSAAVDPDDAGKIAADITVSAQAKIVMSDNSEKTLSLSRDIAVIPSFTVTYHDASITGFSPSVGFGETFHVVGDCRVAVAVTIYFRQPDDLIDPDILRATSLVVNITSVVEPDDD